MSESPSGGGSPSAGGGSPFAGRRTRVLSLPEVRGLAGLDAALEVQRRAFVAQAGGTVTASPNAWLRLPESAGVGRPGWLKILAGHEATSGALGVKVLARFPENPPGSNLGSLVLLFDDHDGFPLAIMDGVYLTAVRTGAGAGLATDLLAAPDASTVGLVGTGVVAWHSLRAVAAVRPSLRAVRIHSRSVDRRSALAARVTAELGLEATGVDTVDAALADAEVVITATNAPEPVVHAEHLRPGQHVNAMGIRTEIAPDAMAAAWVVPDGIEEAVGDGKFSVAIAAGAVRREDLGPELGALLPGPPPERDPTRITLFDSSGVAVQDVTMARGVWELAEERGIGQLIDLGLDEGALD